MRTGQLRVSLPSLPAQYVPTSFETGAVIGRRASDRRAPLKRLAWGFGSILAALVLAVVAWQMPGKLFQDDAGRGKLPTIVVLPLVDMSVDQNEQALCDGLTEELSNWLAHIPTLRVVARTSAFAFKGTNIDVREIARQLGATHVLEGILRRSGNQMRITIQLIEAMGGLHIWSRSFDVPIGDIFLIEDTVSRSVAEAAAPDAVGGDCRAVGPAPAGEDGSVRAVPAGPRAPAPAHRRRQSQGRGISSGVRWRPIRNTCWRWWAWRSPCSTACH